MNIRHLYRERERCERHVIYIWYMEKRDIDFTNIDRDLRFFTNIWKRSCYRIKHQKRRNGRNYKARLCYAQRCKLLVSLMGKPLRKRQFDLEAIFKTLLRGGCRSLPKASRNICSSLILSICGDIMFHPLLVSIRIPSPLEFGWKYWAHIKQLSGFHLLLQAALHCLPILRRDV